MLILRSVLILTLALSSLFSVSPVSSAGRGEIVDRLKAVFVCKFPKYVTWRDSAPKGEFRIAVVGKCGVERYLQELSTADIWGPRAVRVARYEDVGKVGWCHILFVASSVRKDLPRVLAKAKKEGILTVGDTKGRDQFHRDAGTSAFRDQSDRGRASRLGDQLRTVEARDPGDRGGADPCGPLRT